MSVHDGKQGCVASGLLGVRATISRGALERNAQRVVATDGPGAEFDLAADAWGHGSQTVRAVASAHGLRPAECSTPRSQENALRLYGLAPHGTSAGPHQDSEAAMRVHGSVISLKHLRAGEGVSYGFTYRAPRDTTIALVTGGYAQGIVRALGNHVNVTLDGVACAIIGRVAMDVCVVDVGECPTSAGQNVVFFGDSAHGEIPLSVWSAATQLTVQELATGVGTRVVREETA